MRTIFWRNVLLAIAYFCVARVSHLFAFRDLQITAVWLPSGIALASVLVYGPAMLPGILIGDFASGLTFGTAPGTALLVALAGGVQALFGARLISFPNAAPASPLFTVANVIRFVVRGALFAPVASTLIIASSLYMARTIPTTELPRAVAVWWTGDVVGILLVMPLVLLVLARGRPPALRSRWDPALLGLTVAVTAGIFFWPDIDRELGHALVFLILPLVAWCAFVFSASLLAATSLIVAVVALAGTALGLGPYSVTQETSDVWYLQAFIAALSISSLMLRGALEDQRRFQQHAKGVGRQFLAAADNGEHLVLIVRPDSPPSHPASNFQISYANRRARSQFPADCDPTREVALAFALPGLATEPWRQMFERVLIEERSVEDELPVREIDGTTSWYRCTGVPLDRGLLVMLLDITHNKEVEESLAQLAVADSLTGLPNRSTLGEYLDRQIERALVRGGRLGVFFIDLDHFKRINDVLGHQTGDEVLVLVANRLRAAAGEATMVARVGGDEFVVVSVAADVATPIQQILQRIPQAFAAPFLIHGNPLSMTCSIGLALFPEHGSDAHTLLHNADSAMYQAKQRGRHRAVTFDATLALSGQRRHAIEEALRGAAMRGELAMHYQPIASLESGEIREAEALLRWTHPVLGEVAPAEFVGIAEEIGLINAIGRWVFETVARQVKTWTELDYPPIRIAINLSPRQVNRDLPATIRAALSSSGRKECWLDLEITESLFMLDVEEGVDILLELRNMGVQISVDDFGTGYSSLSYLKSLPIDAVKIDRSFVTDLATQARDGRLIGAMIQLCHASGLGTIAEGVETLEQRETLGQMGCGACQGFVLSRALPADEFARRFLQARGRSLQYAEG